MEISATISQYAQSAANTISWAASAVGSQFYRLGACIAETAAKIWNFVIPLLQNLGNFASENPGTTFVTTLGLVLFGVALDRVASWMWTGRSSGQQGSQQLAQG